MEVNAKLNAFYRHCYSDNFGIRMREKNYFDVFIKGANPEFQDRGNQRDENRQYYLLVSIDR